MATKTTPTIVMDPRREAFGGAWNQRVHVDGVLYHVWLERGRSVRMAFARRGQRGYKWYGGVRTEAGKTVWQAEVTKSTGARWMLEAAGLVPLRPSEMAKLHEWALWENESRDRQAIREELAKWGPKPVWEVQLGFISRRGGYR